jgi:hypothetical protein
VNVERTGLDWLDYRPVKDVCAHVVVTLVTSWLTVGRSRTQGSCSEDVSFSGVTRNERARGTNCVMGPPTYVFCYFNG